MKDKLYRYMWMLWGTILAVIVAGLVLIEKIHHNSAIISTQWIILCVGIISILILEFVCICLCIQAKKGRQKDLMEENKNLQLQVLIGQIRPHFILNTLGAIRTLIKRDPDRASDLLYDFSKYVRRNMEQKDYSKPIPFLEELDYIETYLKLETLRFEEKLNVEYDIQERYFRILPLTIQPFVENAVKHGLLEKKGGGTVVISTRREKDGIVIEIRDDGVGFDTKEFWSQLEQRKSVGMKSAILRLQNEMNAVCEVKSNMKTEESGTFIKIKLPEKG